jgi:hypothetical protein
MAVIIKLVSMPLPSLNAVDGGILHSQDMNQFNRGILALPEIVEHGIIE